MKSFKNQFTLEPVKLPVCKLLHMAVGSNHCLAVAEDSLVYSWGDNRCGQLGLGELTAWRNYPIRIDALRGKNIRQVAAGNGFSLFLNNIGLLMSCGDGRQGCLGHGDWNGLTQPRILNRMISVNIVQVKCGTDHVMALSNHGDIYSWGYGKHGRLGLGDEEPRSSPTLVKIPQSFAVKTIYCGGDGSIALTTTGQLLACGLNTSNKLGLSSIFHHCEKALSFTLVKSVKSRIKDVSMGQLHTVLITEEGNMITMGRNLEGQLGRGHCKPKAHPEEVRTLHSKIMVASCGPTYSVVGSTDNVVYFWGTRLEIESKKSQRSTDSGSTSTHTSMKPLKQSFFNVSENNLSSTNTSVNFSSDIVRNCETELIKNPKAVLGLYASPQHVAMGELVWLVNLFSFDNSIFVWVNTTVPPPLKEEKEIMNSEMSSKFMDFETLRRELASLPNTPQPH